MMVKNFWGARNRFSLKDFKIDFLKQITIDPVTKCWNWPRPQSESARYASVHFQGRLWLAHRLAWLLFVEEDPANRKVCHSCDNGFCVNYIEHLFLGSQRDNVLDMEAKGRSYHKSGEMHGRARLTWENVKEIRARSAKGETLANISKSFPIVSKTSVHRIIRNKTWLPDDA